MSTAILGVLGIVTFALYVKRRRARLSRED
jgi:hypothetical protein